jgi:hypothetical protein
MLVASNQSCSSCLWNPAFVCEVFSLLSCTILSIYICFARLLWYTIRCNTGLHQCNTVISSTKICCLVVPATETKPRADLFIAAFCATGKKESEAGD